MTGRQGSRGHRNGRKTGKIDGRRSWRSGRGRGARNGRYSHHSGFVNQSRSLEASLSQFRGRQELGNVLVSLASGRVMRRMDVERDFLGDHGARRDYFGAGASHQAELEAVLVEEDGVEERRCLGGELMGSAGWVVDGEL